MCQELRGTKAMEWLRIECIKVSTMKPCEVRCGNPSQYEAGKESSDRRKGGGSDIPGKVKSEFYSEKGK